MMIVYPFVTLWLFQCLAASLLKWLGSTTVSWHRNSDVSNHPVGTGHVETTCNP